MVSTLTHLNIAIEHLRTSDTDSLDGIIGVSARGLKPSEARAGMLSGGYFVWLLVQMFVYTLVYTETRSNISYWCCGIAEEAAFEAINFVDDALVSQLP